MPLITSGVIIKGTWRLNGLASSFLQVCNDRVCLVCTKVFLEKDPTSDRRIQENYLKVITRVPHAHRQKRSTVDLRKIKSLVLTPLYFEVRKNVCKIIKAMLWKRTGRSVPNWLPSSYYLKKIQRIFFKYPYFIIPYLLIYRLTAFIFNGHKNVKTGSGSVINSPPGSWSVIQDYGSANPEEICTQIPQHWTKAKAGRNATNSFLTGSSPAVT